MSDGDDKGYEDCGEIDIDAADDANIPVDIWLSNRDDDDEASDVWTLRAANYMPRKARIADPAFRATSKSREALVAAVRKHWLPLYLGAADALAEMKPDSDGAASLYYWPSRKPAE